jgi:hypothetical protein
MGCASDVLIFLKLAGSREKKRDLELLLRERPKAWQYFVRMALVVCAKIKS